MSESFYGRSLQHISVKDVYDQLMDLVLKYHIRLPRNLLLLLKTFIQTEALGKILGSDASILEVTKPFAKKLLQRGLNTQSMLRNLDREGRKLSGYTRSIPKHLNDILRETAAGRQRIEVRHTGLDEARSQVEKGVNRLTVGIIIAASIIAGAMILNSGQKIMEFTFGFLGAPDRFAHGNPGSKRLRGGNPSWNLADRLHTEVRKALNLCNRSPQRHREHREKPRAAIEPKRIILFRFLLSPFLFTAHC